MGITDIDAISTHISLDLRICHLSSNLEDRFVMACHGVIYQGAMGIDLTACAVTVPPLIISGSEDLAAGACRDLPPCRTGRMTGRMAR